MANPIDIPQNFSTTLNVPGGITNSQTTGITLTSVTGLPTDGGMLAFDWSNPIDTTAIEYIEYTALSGNDLAGTVTRGQEGYTARSHSNGCTVVGVVSRAHIKRLRDKLTGNDAVAVQDPNGNEIIKTSYVASAVNEVTVTNAATGNAVSISATGGDSNIDINLVPKGSGVLKVNGSAISSAMTNAGAYVKPTTDGDTIRSYDSGGTKYLESTHDGTDSKLTSSSGHIVLTPASSKLVKVTVLRQDDTSNSYVNGNVILTGWGYVNNATGDRINESVTFGITFSSAPIVVVGALGKTTSSVTAITSFDNVNNLSRFIGAHNVSTTGFTVNFEATSTDNMNAASTKFGYSWIAVGPF